MEDDHVRTLCAILDAGRGHVAGSNWYLDADVSTDGAAEQFPIEIPSGIRVEGIDASGAVPSPSDLPRIGGGAGGSVDYLLEIDATQGDRTGIEIRHIRFIGDNEPGLDSAAALVVRAGNERFVSLDFRDNICERPFMNASGTAGSATIHLENNGAIISGSIADSQIQASNRGGVELLSVQEVDGPNECVTPDNCPSGGGKGACHFFIDITDNVITNPGGAYSSFGIRWYAPTPTVAFDPPLNCQIGAWVGNTIIARGSNIENGMVIHAEAGTNGDPSIEVAENVVDGCGSSGFVVKMDGGNAQLTSGMLPETAGAVARNVFTANGGSGISCVWDDASHADDGAGYIQLEIVGNLIADNGGAGLEFRNLGVSSNGAQLALFNTIVNNAQAGERYANLHTDLGATFPGVTQHTSGIMYFNNSSGNGDQVTGLSTAQLALLEANVEYSDWEGLGTCVVTCNPTCVTVCPQGNIDIDPDIIQSTRMYHLDDDSPCIDKGSFVNGEISLDIDGELRNQDGDCMGDPAEMPDMGADELTAPDCPL